MAVDLLIENQLADLDEVVASDITYSLADIRTPDKRQVNFSKTLTLKGTARNNYLFGFIYDINVNNRLDISGKNVGINYNPKKLAKAKLLKDGVQVFDGTLRLWKVIRKGEDVFYEISLFGKLFDIFSAMGDSKLTDLDFSAYNHALTWTNIQNSWSSSFAAPYRYPLIDFGVNVQDLSGRPSTLKFGSLVPCIYYKAYIDKIFSSIGAFYSLNFPSLTIFNKILVTPTTPQVLGQPKHVLANRNAPITYEAPEVFGVRTIFMAACDTVSYNVIGSFSVDKKTINISDTVSTSFQFKVYVRLKVSDTPLYSGGFNPIVQKFNAGGVIKEVLFNNNNERKLVTIEVPRRDYVAGDQVTFSAINVPYYLDVVIDEGSTIKAISPVDSTTYPLVEGDVYDMTQSIPKDIKQVDFIKDFIKYYNLFATQDPDDPTVTIFTPQINFYKKNKAAIVDWSNKVDFDEEIEFTPISQLTAKQYVLTWKQDKDFWNETYFNTNKEVYGQVTFVSDTDVMSNTEKIEMLFSPAVMQGFQSSSVICPAIYKVESGVKKSDKFNSRLLIWGGLLAAGHNIDLLDSDGNVSATVTQYPYAGHLDHPITPTYDLNFSETNSTLAQATENQFNTYWLPALLDAANKDGKLVSCTMLLRPEDIKNLDFAALYKAFNGNLFRLNKISGYNAFELTTCKVELIKVVTL